MKYPWQYDETIQVGTNYQDENEVHEYDDRMQKLRNVAREAAEIQAALRLTMNSIVWEIGTGTGECALALAGRTKHVYATDISPAMLAYARRKAGQRQIHNVTFENGGFLSGFRPDGAVDGIVTQLALHHLPDFWKARALAAIAQSLRPAGRLYLRDVVFASSIADYDAFFQTVVDSVGASAGDEVAQQTIGHIKAEYSTLDWILEGLIERSGMKIMEKDCQGFLRPRSAGGALIPYLTPVQCILNNHSEPDHIYLSSRVRKL
jgi:putative AdoMet-dependent methyltransferase